MTTSFNVHACLDSKAQVRALKGRMNRRRRTFEGVEGSSLDVEYVHNIMLSCVEYAHNIMLIRFTLKPPERSKLFPVVAAVCRFNEQELAQISVRLLSLSRSQSSGHSWLLIDCLIWHSVLPFGGMKDTPPRGCGLLLVAQMAPLYKGTARLLRAAGYQPHRGSRRLFPRRLPT
ncbi:MAG: hypothetical protein SGPRY_002177 [Prymnesium sp.]